MRRMLLALVAVALVNAAWGPRAARADKYSRADATAARHAAHHAWNRGYYHTSWGQPLAYVVPPTAHLETRWGWGVGQNTMTPIYHRFGRAYPGEITGDGNYHHPTPYWPSHTDQFGVYYIRGPW